jgi:hypothetical protein
MDRLNYLCFAATDILRNEEEDNEDFSLTFGGNTQPYHQSQNSREYQDSLSPSLQMGDTQIHRLDDDEEALDNMKLDEYRHLLTTIAVQNKVESTAEKIWKAVMQRKKSRSRYPSDTFYPQSADPSKLSRKPIRSNRNLYDHFFCKFHYCAKLSASQSSLISRLILIDLNDVFDSSLSLQASLKKINKERKGRNRRDITKMPINWSHILLAAKDHFSLAEITELKKDFECLIQK